MQFLGTRESFPQKTDVGEKLRALEHMEEMRKTHPIPMDYDFEETRREAVEEKYGRFT